MADRRNSERLPIEIMVITSTADLPCTQGCLVCKGCYRRSLTGVTYAGTPYHGGAVYSLGGFAQGNGRRTNFENLVGASSDKLGSWPISSDGITDPMAQTAWFYIARGHYAAMPEVAKATRRRGEVGEQATVLVERVSAHLQGRAEAITLPISDIASYDAATELLADLEATGIRDLRDLKSTISDAIGEAERNEALTEDLTARQAYISCMAMLPKGLTKERQARDGFIQIAERFAVDSIRSPRPTARRPHGPGSHGPLRRP